MVGLTPLLGLAAAFALSSAPDAAQTPAATSIPNVVVTAPVPKNVPQLVEHFGQAFSGDRLSRWRDAVCPKVAGLGDKQNIFIADRIIGISRGAKLPAPASHCDPNIYIVFSSQDLADRKKIASHAQGMLTDSRWPADVNQIAAFTKDDGAPVHVYYVTGEAAPFIGGPSIADFGNVTSLESAEYGASLSSFGAPVVLTRPSDLKPALDSAFIRAVVMVDGRQLNGVTQDQIAAYLSMITFAEVKVEQPVRDVASITTLFADIKDGRKPVDGLTFWDRAYLGALYNASTQINISMQRQVMAHRIEQLIEVLPAHAAQTVLDASSLNHH